MIRTTIKLEVGDTPAKINNVPSKDVAFFDIETTGFSPNNTHLYLIGLAYEADGEWVLDQWFAENTAEEVLVLREFNEAVRDVELLVSYNGLGFDTNYLKEKCKQYDIPFVVGKLSHLDIYRQLFPYKKFFKLEHFKQKNIEKFLGIQREDIFSGGELISYYNDYTKMPTEEVRKILLKHNADDIRGLIAILPILTYVAFFRGGFEVSQVDIQRYQNIDGGISMDAVFDLIPSIPLPKHISYGTGPLYLAGSGEKVGLKVSMYTGELKFFYSDYRDYYYLPKEDTAIHKSVAFYVDKNFRTQAKAATCYSKKTGRFLPQFAEMIEPYFKIEFNDKTTYFELTDELCENDVLMKKYLLHCINHML